MGFHIGERVICSESGVIGDIIKFYKPTASENQIMVRTLDGQKYHAPKRTWRPYQFGLRAKQVTVDEFVTSKDQVITEASKSALMSAAAPVLRETMEIHVDGKTLTVYRDEIEKELYKHLGIGLMQLGG